MSVPDPFDQFVADRVASRLCLPRPVGLLPARRAGRPLGVRSASASAGSTAPAAFVGARAGPRELRARRARDEQITTSTCSAWAAAACAPRSCATCGPEQPHAPKLTVLDTTDERTIREATETLVARKHACSSSRARAAATIEVASLERHFWTAGGRRASARRPGGTSSRSPIPARRWRRWRSDRGYRQTFINPPGHRRPLLRAVALRPGARRAASSTHGSPARVGRDDGDAVQAGWLRQSGPRAGRVHGRERQERTRQAHAAPRAGSAEPRRVDRAAGRGEHRQGRPRRPADRRRADRQAVGVRRRPRVRRDPPAVDDRSAAKPAARMRTRRPPGVRDRDGGRRAGRGVLPVGVRDGGGRRVARRQPVRRAERASDAKLRTQAQLDARHARRGVPVRSAVRARAGLLAARVPAAMPAARRRALRRDPRLSARRSRGAPTSSRACARALRERTHLATTYGSGRDICTPRASTTRAGRTPGCSCSSPPPTTAATPVPGTDYTFSALKYAQALGDFDALAAAGRHVVHYHIEDPAADFSAALESVLRGYR